MKAAGLPDLRKDYRADQLDDGDLADDPIEQFRAWFEVARGCEAVAEPNAMTLATADGDGRPSARTVLLKGIEADALRFFTNYESRKGREMAVNPWVALTFHWNPLERQVLVTGRAERLGADESREYFHSRPRESQLGAWASRQSELAESRDALEAAFEQVRTKFNGGEIPLPPFWGGYRVVPESFEFWQGRTGRLHDRFRYERGAGGAWVVRRLQP
ncbi:MAG: pyridoxamine 5'-phosphate oxidase [Chthoniobacterales bacterium]